MNLYEKEVVPTPEDIDRYFNAPMTVTWHNAQYVPGRKLVFDSINAVCGYDPGTLKFDGNEVQDITVYPSRPLFLMSPGNRVYRKTDVFEMKAILSKFTIMPESDDGEPTAEITFTPTEMKL